MKLKKKGFPYLILCAVVSVFFGAVKMLVGIYDSMIGIYGRGTVMDEIRKGIGLAAIAIFLFVMWFEAWKFQYNMNLIEWANPVRYEDQFYKQEHLIGHDPISRTVYKVEKVGNEIRIYIREVWR